MELAGGEVRREPHPKPECPGAGAGFTDGLVRLLLDPARGAHHDLRIAAPRQVAERGERDPVGAQALQGRELARAIGREVAVIEAHRVRQAHAALESVGRPPHPRRRPRAAGAQPSERVGGEAVALLDARGTHPRGAAQAVERPGRPIRQQREQRRAPARPGARQHRAHQHRARRHQDERRAPRLAARGGLAGAGEHAAEVGAADRARQRLALEPAAQRHRRGLQVGRARGGAEPGEARGGHRPQVECRPPRGQRRGRGSRVEVLGPGVARQRALLFERAVERERDRARGGRGARASPRRARRRGAARRLAEAERVEAPQQRVGLRQRRGGAREPGRRRDRHRRGAGDAQRRGEAARLVLAVAVERRIVAPRTPGRLREHARALEFAVAVDAPVLGAEEEAPAFAIDRRRRVPGHQQQEAVRIERVGIDEMEHVAGAVVVAPRPAEPAGRELDRQRRAEAARPLVLRRPAEQDHRAARELLGAHVLIGPDPARVGAEQAPRHQQRPCPQHRGLGRIARAVDEQPALVLVERPLHLLAGVARRRRGERGEDEQRRGDAERRRPAHQWVRGMTLATRNRNE